MGKWTNSSHVFRAVGGYTSISSNSIAQRVDTTVIDNRLLVSTMLAASNCEDMYHITRQRYREMKDGDEQFFRDLRHYNVTFKPPQDHISECLMGSNVVLASDSFAMHNALFNRDSLPQSNGGGDNRAAQERRSVDLLFVLMHLPSKYGRHPFNTNKKFIHWIYT